MDVDHETYYRALCARDPRFDGLFFVGVTTTKIYCRPVCPAKTPGRNRCRFFTLAAAAVCIYAVSSMIKHENDSSKRIAKG